MLFGERLAIKFVGQQEGRASRVVDVQAAGEVLRIILLANFLALLVRTEEHDLDAAFQRRAVIEQISQRRAGPAHVADRAHEGRAQAVAAALESSGNGATFAGFDFRQRELFGFAHQAGDFQDMAARIQRRRVVMADDVKVLGFGGPTRQVLPARLVFDGWLGIQKRNQHTAFFRGRTAKERERVLTESDGGGGEAGALEHLAARERMGCHRNVMIKTGSAGAYSTRISWLVTQSSSCWKRSFKVFLKS